MRFQLRIKDDSVGLYDPEGNKIIEQRVNTEGLNQLHVATYSSGIWLIDFEPDIKGMPNWRGIKTLKYFILANMVQKDVQSSEQIGTKG